MRWIMIAAAATLALAACSNSTSGGAYGAGGGGTTSSAAPAAAPAQVATAKVGNLGTVLVDGNGMTLYLFESDTSSTSTCTGSCAGTWPALTTSGSASATGSVDASLLGTSTRPDGTTQVTYNGHPLYVYSGDTATGQANGEGIGGIWFAVTTQGTAAKPMGGSGGNGGGSNYGGGGW